MSALQDEKPLEEEVPDLPPGYGIDRTQIHRLLAVSVAERLRLAGEEGRALAEFDAMIRRARE